MATWESRLGRKDCYYTQIPGGFGKCYGNFFKFSLALKTFLPKVRLKPHFLPALSQLLKQ
jgi:hypothetical protein